MTRCAPRIRAIWPPSPAAPEPTQEPEGSRSRWSRTPYRTQSPQATRCQDASWAARAVKATARAASRGRIRGVHQCRRAPATRSAARPSGQERHRQRQVESEAHRERGRHPPEEPDVHESGHHQDRGHGHQRGERPEGGDGGGETAPGAAARRRTDRRRPAAPRRRRTVPALPARSHPAATTTTTASSAHCQASGPFVTGLRSTPRQRGDGPRRSSVSPFSARNRPGRNSVNRCRTGVPSSAASKYGTPDSTWNRDGGSAGFMAPSCPVR